MEAQSNIDVLVSGEWRILSGEAMTLFLTYPKVFSFCVRNWLVEDSLAYRGVPLFGRRIPWLFVPGSVLSTV